MKLISAVLKWWLLQQRGTEDSQFCCNNIQHNTGRNRKLATDMAFVGISGFSACFSRYHDDEQTLKTVLL